MLKSLIAALALCAGTAAAQTYDVAFVPASSSVSWSFSLGAPFQSGGASFIIGDWDLETNPLGTRTIPGFSGGDTSANTPVNVTGSVSSSATSGGTPLRPDGGLRITLDTEAGACQVSGLVLDLLNGATAGGDANASITYSTFRTRQPTCLIFGGFPINVPLGSATVTGLVAAQQDASNAGALTDAGGGSYTFTVPMIVLATVDVVLAGTPTPLDAIPFPIVLTGTITPGGPTASLTASVQVNEQITQETATQLPEIPFDEPLCGGSLLLNLVLASVNTTVTINATIVGSGTGTPPACDPDFNQDGNVDQDDVGCLAQVVAGDPTCSSQDPDFNRDGNVDQDDIAALTQVVGGAACP
ncbi:MAG: hypothetical protein SFY69_01660 [Planctomycetota bacterium]|nr:hypothetical protein [Planctomycetota bacterium]